MINNKLSPLIALLLLLFANCSITVDQPEDNPYSPNSHVTGQQIISLHIDSLAHPVNGYLRQSGYLTNQGNDTIVVRYLSGSIYSDSTEMLCLGYSPIWPEAKLLPNAIYQFDLTWNPDTSYHNASFRYYHVEYFPARLNQSYYSVINY